MLSYPRRLQSGQITCYLNRTYHVLTTLELYRVDLALRLCENPRIACFPARRSFPSAGKGRLPECVL
jgi:hypothetical protein